MEDYTFRDDKLFYSIAEVSKILQLPYSTLRYWEKEFKSLKPYKNKRGVRFYKWKDIDLLKKIVYLTKEKQYTLDGAKKALKEKEFEFTIEQKEAITQGHQSRVNIEKQMEEEEIKSTLNETKKFLLELKNKLEECNGR